MSWKPQARGVRKAHGIMNQLETDYHTHLQERMVMGEIIWMRYEAITLKLGQDCRYTPDFAIMLPDCTIELHETKGFMHDYALVKIKTAAAQFPFRIVLVTRQAKKDGGAWIFKVY